MKVSVNSSINTNKLNLVLALWLGLIALAGISGCHNSSSKDPDPVVTIPDLTVSLPTVAEGDSVPVELAFTVTLSEAVDQTLTVDYTTVDETATVADNDYTAVSGTLTIPAGSTTANVSVYANGDTYFETDETFTLVVSNIQGATLGASSYSGQGMITNDDNAEPKGYFTGTATLNGTDYTDITALVYDNRVLMFSPTANVLYDIAMTPALGAYTGTVEVYVDGVIEQVSAVTVSGTTDESQLEGTFSGGTGFGAGSFEVVFDTENNKAATAARITTIFPNFWRGNLYGYDKDAGTLASSNGNYQVSDGNNERCISSNTNFVIPPEGNINIYQLSHPLEKQSVGTCSPPYESTGHTGFAAVVDDAGTDDMMVFAFNNDNIALFGIMHH